MRMDAMKSLTRYAPAERVSAEQIKEQHNLLADAADYHEIFNALNVMAFIVNSNRQIVYANRAFIDAFGFENMEKFLGTRPGEAVGCIHSSKEAYGCGTSEACRYCGAVNAVLEAQRAKTRVEQECRITSTINGSLVNFDLMVTAYPITVSGGNYIVVSMQDIGSEKRKRNLERIFFHDILNMAGGLNGLMNLLGDMENKNEAGELISLAEKSSRNIIDEIESYRLLVSAESGDLTLSITGFDAAELVDECVQNIRYHVISRDRDIIFENGSDKVEIFTDRLLLSRILINMLKNAMEASGPGSAVTAGFEVTNSSSVRFLVRNSSVMTVDTQQQVFQRSFSTKDLRRGLGTYSMKLLGENYLKGKVGFISNENEGTVFFIDLPVQFPVH
jgi:signal transduction histidine kinase